MEAFNSDERLFVFEKEKWRKICETDYSIPEAPSVTEIDNGIILPLINRIDIHKVGAFWAGGVCDKDGNFIAGNCRDISRDYFSQSCTAAYPITTPPRVRHETVVYGGILNTIFGHAITDSLPRLWWFADHQETKYKLVFLRSPRPVGFDPCCILEAAGITEDRMEIINEPTRFDKIIVPEEALYMFSGYRPGVRKIYDLIRSRVTPGPYKKVYLSRSAYEEHDLFNEKYFEDFFSKRGYEIVHPEQLPFTEQISIMAGADEVAAPSGTLSLLTLFCRPHTRTAYLTRCEHILISEIICLQALDINYSIVDIHLGFLPTKMTGHNIYFVAPTTYWEQYLNQSKIAYTVDEVSVDLHVKPFVYDYVVKWGQHEANPKHYKNIHDFTLIDVVSSINTLLLQTEIDKESFPDRDDVTQLKRKRAALKKQNDSLTAQIKRQRAMFENDSLLIQISDLLKQYGTLSLQVNALISQLKEMEDLKVQITEKEKEIFGLKMQLRGMESSLSWSITKPLRTFNAWFKCMFKK